MQKNLLLKAAIVLGLMLLIAVPLIMIQATIGERISFHHAAVQSIADDSVSTQTLTGPVLILPYTDDFDEKEAYTDGKIKRTKVTHHPADKRLLLFPTMLTVAGAVQTKRRYRGIHQVLTYTSVAAISGEFSVPSKTAVAPDDPTSTVIFGTRLAALSIRDVRGIRKLSALDVDGQAFVFNPGTELKTMKNGVHAALPLPSMATDSIWHFNFKLEMDGMERLSITPIANNSQVTLRSNWPHPQFGGNFLPVAASRIVNADGFSASWSISSLASSAQQQLANLESGTVEHAKDDVGVSLQQTDVSFIEPINNYSQADRAVKYGMLFVALTFVGFFLFEALKQLPVHPIQYILVGLALALFFLLLTSLSEHLHFATAYLIASTACIALIGFYLSFVMNNWRHGFGFGAALTVLYGALCGLLQSESNALVLGSGLLFVVLGTIMVWTRRVNWYQIGKPVTISGDVQKS